MNIRARLHLDLDLRPKLIKANTYIISKRQTIRLGETYRRLPETTFDCETKELRYKGENYNEIIYITFEELKRQILKENFEIL
jgi:hypothetical protein